MVKITLTHSHFYTLFCVKNSENTVIIAVYNAFFFFLEKINQNGAWAQTIYKSEHEMAF